MRQPHALRDRAIAGVLAGVIALSVALLPRAVLAKGTLWLRTVLASKSPVLIHPSVATYRNHAYILSVHETTTDKTSVYFTTNESKRWKTTLVSSTGPRATYSQEFVGLAIDASQNKLYATWIYQKDRQYMSLGVWTRTGSGAWSGPTEVATSGALVGEPSIVAGGGRATIAFQGTPQSYAGSCDDRYTHAEDVLVTSTTGAGWSAPQNVTSCATAAEASSFNDPKIAMDEDGKMYLVSRAGAAEGNLWYADTTSGAWSQANTITTGLKIPDYAGSPALRTLYGIAASHGTAYIVYTTGRKNGHVLLLVHGTNGSVSASVQASLPDKDGCPQFGVSVAARAGRVAVSYIRAYGGNCTVISPTNDYNTLHVVSGTAAHLTSVAPGLPRTASCGDSALSTDGDLFRLAADCGLGSGQEYAYLYYKKEFLDVVGPKARLAVAQIAGGGTVRLRWSAHDPTPGSGVAYFQLAVRQGNAPWRLVVRATRARTLVYHAQPSRSYIFRLRARDRVNNWGRWVSAHVRG